MRQRALFRSQTDFTAATAACSNSSMGAEPDESISARIAALPWPVLLAALDARGYAVTPAILTPRECDRLAALYVMRDHFRSRIEMARFGYGLGEYNYFAH